MRYYSPSTVGFFDSTIHGADIPADAIEITDERHAELMAGQARGRIIAVDEDGHPVLLDPPPPTIEQQQAALDAFVTDWIDRQAQAAGFRNAAYLVSYFNSINEEWKAIARAFVPWRDGIWAQCLAILEAVVAGTRGMPTIDDLLAELPPFAPIS
jgi:hypothetical protein